MGSRRGLAFYNLGMQKDAWNDLAEWMGGAPRYVRKQLASPHGFDLFRMELNPKVPHLTFTPEMNHAKSIPHIYNLKENFLQTPGIDLEHMSLIAALHCDDKSHQCIVCTEGMHCTCTGTC